MANIGLISDTHGRFEEDWKKHFSRCDMIFHMGDFADKDVYENFMDLEIPIQTVRGNCDFGLWAHFLPKTQIINVEGKNFCLLHNRAFLPDDVDDIDFVIFGHTHIPTDEVRGGIRFINPGSAGQDRGAGRTMMIMHIDGDSVELEKIPL